MDTPDMRRFEFGSNWESYSRNALTPARAAQARADFHALLGGIELQNRSFLDVGFGQGLAAALACEAGAQVTAVDIDPNCLAAFRVTREFIPGRTEPDFVIGSILDPALGSELRAKGPYDVVHSWGVLHHTGDLWRALDIAATLVRPGGHLLIALYARHWTSPLWKAVKWTYVHVPGFLRRAMIAACRPLMLMRAHQLGEDGTGARGMEFEHDLVDWIGGHPYEWAARSDVEERLAGHGFRQLRFQPTAGMTGCHEYVFRRDA
jgi:SAM-dependent methyltransferase